jgi:hypothetical protein
MHKGRVHCIRSSDQGSALGFSTYVCQDDELAKQIEKSSTFNKVFFVYHKEEPKKVVKENTSDTTTPYPKVKKIQDAIAVLESDFNVPSDSVVSKADALRLASQFNISFPNLK